MSDFTAQDTSARDTRARETRARETRAHDTGAHGTSAQDALVMLMVMVSASDRAMKDEELAKIGQIVSSFPVFNGYSHDRLVATSETASLALSEEGGLDAVVKAIAEAIPERLRDTAYACGVEVAAADLSLRQEELRVLQMLRDAFGLDKLTVAALERSAMARYRGV